MQKQFKHVYEVDMVKFHLDSSGFQTYSNMDSEASISTPNLDHHKVDD
jgi:hypothetical protein